MPSALPDTSRHALRHPAFTSTSQWPHTWAGQGGQAAYKSRPVPKGSARLACGGFTLASCVPEAVAWCQSAIHVTCPISPSHTVG